MLHDHDEMIELNPLVIEHHPIKTPRDAPADEFLDCVWQELTDRIHYLPGGMVKGRVSYKACFHDLPRGLQTHIYAPTGLDIREHWSIGGSLPGEPEEPRELGLDTPRQGLYLREDCDMRSNRMLTRFIRKNLDEAHKTLVERILKKAQRIERHRETMSTTSSQPSWRQSAVLQPGSHMANSKLLKPAGLNQPMSSAGPQMLSPQQDGPNLADHPAFRSHGYNQSSSSTQSNSLNSYNSSSNHSKAYTDTSNSQPPSEPKAFIAELPGSTYHTSHLANSHANNRESTISEMSGSDATKSSDKGSRISSEQSPVYAYTYNPQDFVRQDDRDARRANRMNELPGTAQ